MPKHAPTTYPGTPNARTIPVVSTVNTLPRDTHGPVAPVHDATATLATGTPDAASKTSNPGATSIVNRYTNPAATATLTPPDTQARDHNSRPDAASNASIATPEEPITVDPDTATL